MNVSSRFADYLRRGSLFGSIAADSAMAFRSDLDVTEVESVEDAGINPSSVPTIICATLLCIYALYLGRTLFVPIATGLFAYLAICPFMRILRDFGVPSTPAAVLVSVTATISIGLAFYFLSGPFTSLVNGAPETVSNAKLKLAFLFDQLQTLNRMTTDESAGMAEIAGDKQSPVLVKIQQPA